MKALFALAFLSLLVLGCTQPAPPTAEAQTAAVAPAPNGVVTQDVQAAMDRMMEEKGVGTQVGQGEMPLSVREAMVESQNGATAMTASQKFVRVQYDVAGSASIVERDGKKYLAFSDEFATRAGPKLVVRLSKSAAPSTNAALDASENVLLGNLVDVQGYQEYELPADYGQYASVLVFCEPFRVIWGYAPLK